jgi:cyclase
VSVKDVARFVLLSLFAFQTAAHAQPAVSKVGADLYAYISDNDGSSNATFLVGQKGVLVVDTGRDAKEGGKLLAAIRKVSNLPVLFIINTHYHPDHQGGNAVVGPSATVISTDYTRQQTLAGMKSQPEWTNFRPADVTFSRHLTLHLDPYVAEIYFPGKAHTSGDALVYFPQQQVIATGDLFLNRSSPAMDRGSVANWIQALNEILEKPLQAAVPGHFELATPSDVRRFHDYLYDLYSQVEQLRGRGASLEQIKSHLNMEKYRDFRQYPQYHATFADNAEVIYKELQH